MMTKRTTFILLVFLVAGLVAACEQRSPIYVYVTPTPLPQIGAVTTPVPTLSQTPIPTVEPQGQVTAAASRPTLTPRVTFVGPIIGPNYTLPPTSTPRDTATPTDGPTDAAPTDRPTREGPAPTALPNLDSTQLGLQLDINLDENAWRDAVGRRLEEDLDFHWVKVQIAWEDLQPNGPTDYGETFRRVEQYLQYADFEQLNILVSIAKAPAWARSNQNEDGPPDNPQALADFLTFFLSKVPFVDAVEVWNEPNLQREWQGSLPFNGAGYMQLFTPAYQAIKSGHPNIRIVTAGLAPTGNNPGSRDDRQYLREMYANGLAQYSDVSVGVHPYSWANAPDATCCGDEGWDEDPHFFFADTMREYRQILDANGHNNVELWPTEFGWATWDGLPGDPPETWMGFTDRWEQGNFTIRALHIGQESERIGPMFLWNLNFAMLTGMVDNRDERAAYSLLVPLEPMERPLYWMIYDAVRPDEELERYD